jgi:hypothetical protein
MLPPACLLAQNACRFHHQIKIKLKISCRLIWIRFPSNLVVPQNLFFGRLEIDVPAFNDLDFRQSVPDGVSDKIGLVKVQSRLDQLPDLRCLLRRDLCPY